MALTNKGNFIINGIEFKPKNLKINYESLQASDTGRTDDGILHINWVRRRIHKLEITMPPITASEVSRLLLLVQGKEYNITFFDIVENQEKTIYAYTSNSSADCYSGVVRNGFYQGVAFNAIEV